MSTIRRASSAPSRRAHSRATVAARVRDLACARSAVDACAGPARFASRRVAPRASEAPREHQGVESVGLETARRSRAGGPPQGPEASSNDLRDFTADTLRCGVGPLGIDVPGGCNAAGADRSGRLSMLATAASSRSLNAGEIACAVGLAIAQRRASWSPRHETTTVCGANGVRGFADALVSKGASVGAPDGVQSGDHVESNRDRSTTTRIRSGPTNALQTNRFAPVGAGRSQVQILSPRSRGASTA
jgi:hypothetical protein